MRPWTLSLRVARAFVPVLTLALVLSACGGVSTEPSASVVPAGASASSAAASPGASVGPTAATSPGAGLVEYADASDPVAASRLESALVQELRDQAGMPALLGDAGPAVFAALDDLEAAFGRGVVQDAASAIGGTAAAGGRPGLPLAAPHVGPSVIETSLFTETGFMANAVMSMFTTLVERAGTDGSVTIPREEHHETDQGGLHQDITLSTTITVKTGGGRASGDVTISATDRISKPDGTFVALYTSSANGHFDVNACPDAGGIGAGTYTFQTKHELNDVSGASNARSAAGRSVEAPFQLVNGEDAKLQRIEATLDLAADAQGPGTAGGPGPTSPFGWTAAQQVSVVMPAGGGTTATGGAGTSTGTGATAAVNPMQTSQLFAMLFFGQIGKEAETFWRSGACIDLKPSRDTSDVDPGEQVDLTVTATAKFGDHAEVKAPIVATFTGKATLDPTDQPVDPPSRFTFKAGDEEGDKGTIDLKQTSRRGIGKRQVVYTVSGKPLLLSLTSKSVSNTAPMIITYEGKATDLPLTRQDGIYHGTGPIDVRITLKMEASGAECSGHKDRTEQVGVKAVPVPDHPDQVDLSFEYTPGFQMVTMTCRSKEGTGSMPAPWSGLISVLPLPGETKRVTIDSPAHIVLPPAPDAITIDLTLRKAA